ncbi:MAG: carotenoid biosynthesis protein [Syntrophobacteraceae bacterium]
MPEVVSLLFGTVVLRPYVFAFLAVYIVAGCKHIGWKKTLAYIPVGYALAWTSEYCSINFGFPYGDYYYIPATVDRELWVLGVPFMDSLSYVFLSYCSYSLALFLMSPVTYSSPKLHVWETPELRRSWRTLVLGAFLFMMLDVIIDPVAFLGDRWFLGKIYGYRHEGFYFGIPMSNFGGWFLVGVVLMGALQALDRAAFLAPDGSSRSTATLWMRLLGPILYVSVMVFNIAVTFAIGEYLLGFVDLVIASSLLVMIFFFTAYKLRHASAPGAAPAGS